MVDPRGRPVEIRLQPLLLEHERLDPLGEVFERFGGGAAGQVAAHRAQEFRPHVALLVDAMAESHHHALRGKLLHQPGLGPLGRPDRRQHLEHLLVGAAVQRALERPDRAHDAGVHVGACRDDRAGRERGGVELVLRVEDERRAEDRRMGGRRCAAGEPLEQRRGDRALGPWRHGPAGGEIHPGGEHGRHLPEEPLGLGEERRTRAGEHVALDLSEQAHAGAEGVHRGRVGPGCRQPGQAVDHGRIERAGRGVDSRGEGIALRGGG